MQQQTYAPATHSQQRTSPLYSSSNNAPHASLQHACRTLEQAFQGPRR